MDSNMLIPIIAIVTPFAFAAWVIHTGIKSKERKRGLKESQQQATSQSDRELEVGIRNLEKRIENLEIILRNKNKE